MKLTLWPVLTGITGGWLVGASLKLGMGVTIVGAVLCLVAGAWSATFPDKE